MSKREDVSISVIRRLPRYYRFLGDLLKTGVYRISSKELALRMGITASQIRQDLNCFGGFGQQGYGYNVEQLHAEIANILGLDKKYKLILLGAGNLGRTIATQMKFEEQGFELIGIFDKKESLIGEVIRGLPVRSIDTIDEFCKTYQPVTAVFCIPKNSALEYADRLAALGIKGFWNFSHLDISIGNDDIVVENVHLGDSLMTLSYKIHDALK